MVRALNPGLPVFLLGASMGGCLCTRVAEQISTTSPMDGVILLCPALNVDKVKRQCKNRVLLPLVGCLSRLVPTLPLGDKAVNTMFPVMVSGGGGEGGLGGGGGGGGRTSAHPHSRFRTPSFEWTR